MLFPYNYFKKHCHVDENIFLNLVAECSLILDYSIHKIFRDVNSVNFILNVIDRKYTKFIICNGLACFELALGTVERSNQVKSKKAIDRPITGTK